VTSAANVLAVLDRLEGAGIDVWIDGGWGIDALVGEQTREHDDVDLVVPLASVGEACGVLAELGFNLTLDWLPTRCQLRDGEGRAVDLHPVAFARDGSAVQAARDGGSYEYPAQGFTGRGAIAGRAVRCLSAEVQVRHHTGYRPTDVDRRDMQLLRNRLGVELPGLYGDR
jgi:lincosamide nucleotidyltransferase A/C/D/E